MNRRIIPALLSCLLLCGTATAFAHKPPSSSSAAAAEHPSSLEQAVKQVQRRTQGHILTAQTVSRGRPNVYRIKVLTPQGQVLVVQLHLNTHAGPKAGPPSSNRGGH